MNGDTAFCEPVVEFAKEILVVASALSESVIDVFTASIIDSWEQLVTAMEIISIITVTTRP